MPPKVSDYQMVPFAELQMNFDGVMPDGWKKLGPGTYTPTGKATDPVGLIQQVAPLPADTLLNLLGSQLKVTHATIKFEQTGTRSANGIDWKLYSAGMSAWCIDLAVGEKDRMTYLVMMQSLSIDRKVLYEAIFLPAVDALKPAK